MNAVQPIQNAKRMTLGRQVMVFDDTTNTYKAVANNPDLSYPIKLDGEKCMPSTLQLCLDGYITPADDKCCKTMKEDNQAEPYSTVPFSLLLTIMFPLPIVVLLLRVNAGYVHGKEPRPWVTYLNEVIGLLYTLVYTNLITECFKHLVGRPRPMYYALMIFSEVFKDDREHTRDQANLSFPSGHSSLSMAAWAFVAYILFADALALRHKYPKVSYAFVHVAGGGIMFAIWVASTRITDYWHHVVSALIFCGFPTHRILIGVR